MHTFEFLQKDRIVSFGGFQMVFLLLFLPAFSADEFRTNSARRRSAFVR